MKASRKLAAAGAGLATFAASATLLAPTALGNGTVEVCHNTGSAINPSFTITIASQAVQAHVGSTQDPTPPGHGDQVTNACGLPGPNISR